MQCSFEKVDCTFKSHHIFSNVVEFQYFPIYRCFTNTLQADHWYARVRVFGLLWIVNPLHERRKTVNLKGLRTPDIDTKPRLHVPKWSEGYNCTVRVPVDHSLPSYWHSFQLVCIVYNTNIAVEFIWRKFSNDFWFWCAAWPPLWKISGGAIESKQELCAKNPPEKTEGEAVGTKTTPHSWWQLG